MKILRREKINNVLFYRLANGWHITSAQCSRDRQGVPGFSIWRPSAEAWGGSLCCGGASTLRAALAEVERQSPPPPETPLFPTIPAPEKRFQKRAESDKSAQAVPEEAK